MSEGIKELSEFVTGIFKIGEIVAVELKDNGPEVKDLGSILSKAAMDKDVQEAFKGLLEKGLAELKDLDWSEGVQLGVLAVSKIPAIIKAATGK